MKLKQSEKLLLVILLIVSLGALYYFNVYLKQAEHISELESEVNELSNESNSITQKLTTNLFNKSKLSNYQNKIVELAPNYYGSLSQSEYVMLVRDIADRTGVSIRNLSLDENKKTISEYIGKALNINQENSSEESENIELSEEDLAEVITVHSASIAFEASYQQIYDFVAAISSNDKELSIRQFNIQRTNDKLSGQMVIVTHNVPSIDAFVDKNISLNYFKNASQPIARTDLFEQPVLASIPEASTVEQAFNVKDTLAADTPEQAEVPIEQLEKADSLVDFKNSKFFFAGNKPEIIGQIKLQKVPNLAVKAAELDYKFSAINHVNQANIVFIEKSVMYENYFAKMRLKAFNDQSFNNVIKAEVIDARAKHHIVEFSKLETSDKWQYSYADMPTDMQYPIMVRRIFVEGNNLEQDLSGKLYFDNLAAVVSNFKQMDGEVDDEEFN